MALPLPCGEGVGGGGNRAKTQKKIYPNNSFIL